MDTVYSKYGVKKVINASGKMTILGGSRVCDGVSEACREGASNFFVVQDLLKQTGAYLAKLMGVEDSYIVSSASSGIAQCVAASIAGSNMERILHLHDQSIRKRDIIIAKGHNVDYGTPIEVTIRLGGGEVVEAGYANACSMEHVESKISEHTAALLYVKSHHCVQKGMLSIEEMASLAKKYNVPFIVDAAAEEDLTRYYHMGADVVIYSGTKALQGPTSGVLVGREQFLANVKLQSKGIGRVMKVGKENILGLTYAIEQYLDKDHMSMDMQKQRLAKFNDLLNQIDGVHATWIQDGAGRAIIRSEISFDEEVLGICAKAIATALKEGDLAIYTRDYRANIGIIEIDIRDVFDQELQQIYDKIDTILKGAYK